MSTTFMRNITHRQLFLSHVAQTSRFPLALEIDSAEGVYMHDVNGKKYYDLISGIGVSNVGHRHPAVVAAIKEQVDRYLHLMVYGEYVQAPQVLLAAALVGSLDSPLAETAPYGPINRVYFTNSGTEAVEGAMKLAKRFTGRFGFVACKDAYHGASQGALSLAGQAFFQENFRPLLPGMTRIRYGVVEDLEQIDHRTAGLVIEPIGGESGVRVPDIDYMRAVRKRCTETGTLLILDEVQTGFGRSGTFWAFEDFGIYPDILLSAKGMGGGMPIGAFMASETVMSVLMENPILGHITTFGGHPVSCAAALAAFDVIQSERLHEAAGRKGQLIKDYLGAHPLVKEVRGKGLMLAVEFDSFPLLKQIIDRLIEVGIVTDWFLFCDHSMRIAPPLIITEEQISEVCRKIIGVLDEIELKVKDK
ncbi:aspartate aminotransferase family protein [Ravibacter arvi]|uniref:Aspartate aminotransferase family protein n=1 Tax=Ravibacter arvi TaxID=2051041 RepID=A0ABP8M2K9_9BACT